MERTHKRIQLLLFGPLFYCNYKMEQKIDIFVRPFQHETPKVSLKKMKEKKKKAAAATKKSLAIVDMGYLCPPVIKKVTFFSIAAHDSLLQISTRFIDSFIRPYALRHALSLSRKLQTNYTLNPKREKKTKHT